MRKTVLITGGNFTNQGAYLMVAAAAEALRDRGLAPAMSIQTGSEREKRWLGLDTVTYSDRLGFHLGRPRGISRRSTAVQRLPYVASNDVDAVVDVSGFVFSDEWVALDLERRAKNLTYWARRGIPLILLPQAFGPFTSDVARSSVRQVAASASLVFAREDASLGHLVQACGLALDSEKLSVAPDFTFSVRPEPVVGLEGLAGGVALVPNWNIAQRLDEAQYLGTLRAWLTELRERGERPFFLCHEGGRDRALIDVLAAQEQVQVVSGLNGCQSRTVLSRCRFAVSARFHAAVSCIATGVPVFLHGWSHKYRELASDVGVTEFISDPVGGRRSVRDSLECAEDLESVRATLRAATGRLVSDSERMWDEVARVVLDGERGARVDF